MGAGPVQESIQTGVDETRTEVAKGWGCAMPTRWVLIEEEWLASAEVGAVAQCQMVKRARSVKGGGARDGRLWRQSLVVKGQDL